MDTPCPPAPGRADVLLQGMQGLLFQMQAAHDLLPGRPDEARSLLALALQSGDAAIARALLPGAGDS